jgi:hypothetical protein
LRGRGFIVEMRWGPFGGPFRPGQHSVVEAGVCQATGGPHRGDASWMRAREAKVSHACQIASTGGEQSSGCERKWGRLALAGSRCRGDRSGSRPRFRVRALLRLPCQSRDRHRLRAGILLRCTYSAGRDSSSLDACVRPVRAHSWRLRVRRAPRTRQEPPARRPSELDGHFAQLPGLAHHRQQGLGIRLLVARQQCLDVLPAACRRASGTPSYTA